MILNSHLSKLEARLGDEQFLRPDYACYSFAQIPSLIELLLGTRQGDHPFTETVLSRVRPQPQNVVLILVDGFGYQQWLKYADWHPFFRTIVQRGSVMPITTLFPSTTAASVTTINTGLTPQEHGLIEFRLYFEEIDQVIYTLPFAPLGPTIQQDALLKDGVDPRILFNGASLHTRLQNHGIASHVVLRNTYANSAYSSVSQAGATVIPYRTAADMAVLLRQRVNNASTPSYFYVYWDSIDHMSHTYGPHSECYRAELNMLSHLLQTELLNKIDRRVAENTVLLVTADHGHPAMYPDKTIYLNDMPLVMNALATSPVGRTIHPWGSPRDVFLQVKEDKLDEVVACLTKQLAGKARIVRSQAEADKGLFGFGPEHPQFRKRIGNILILPYEYYTVWHQYPGLEKSKHRGSHGGLSREEMLTVLGFATLSELL